MKKILDLSKYNTTEELCGALNKQINKTKKRDRVTQAAFDMVADDLAKEKETAPKSRQNILKRMVNWLKKAF